MGGFLASVLLENISTAISLVPNSDFYCLGHSPIMPEKSLYCLPFWKTSRPISTISFSPNNQPLCNFRKVSELIFPQLFICYLNCLFDFIISSSARDPVTTSLYSSSLWYHHHHASIPGVKPKQIFPWKHFLCVCWITYNKMDIGTGFLRRNNRIWSKNPQTSEDDGDENACWDLLNHLTLEFASDWELG